MQRHLLSLELRELWCICLCKCQWVQDKYPFQHLVMPLCLNHFFCILFEFIQGVPRGMYSSGSYFYNLVFLLWGSSRKLYVFVSIFCSCWAIALLRSPVLLTEHSAWLQFGTTYEWSLCAYSDTYLVETKHLFLLLVQPQVELWIMG